MLARPNIPRFPQYSMDKLQKLNGSERRQLKTIRLFLVSNEDLTFLTNLPALEGLDVFGENIGDAGVGHLRNIKSLKTLVLGDTKITDSGLKVLGNLPNLEYLWLTGTGVTDAGLKDLTGLRKLKVLRLPVRITNEGLKSISRMQAVEELDISDSESCNFECLRTIGTMPQVRILNLRGLKITDGSLEFIKNQKLIELNLSSTEIRGPGFIHLKELTNLRTLYLHGAAINDDGLFFIGKLSGLEYLNLGKTGISDAGLSKLGGLTALKELILMETSVTAKGIKKIMHLSVENLVLNRCPVGNELVDILIEMKSLKSVELEGTKVSESSLRRLREQRPNLRIE